MEVFWSLKIFGHIKNLSESLSFNPKCLENEL